MTELHEVSVPTLDPSRLRPVIGVRRYGHLQGKAEDFRVWLGGTRIWNVNSTASGGGVAEMLQVLVGYSLGLGLDVRWLVMHGDTTFFAITKRLHNRIHGAQGDGGTLGDAEAAHYLEVTEANPRALLLQARPGDVVILHDPQAAGLATILSEAGLHVVWRCHIGADHRNAWTEEAWNFLRPHIGAAAVVVFSRAAYVPPDVPDAKVAVIPPSIDPFSPKNQHLSSLSRQHVLRRIGVLGPAEDSPTSSFAATGRRARWWAGLRSSRMGPRSIDALVVQVSAVGSFEGHARGHPRLRREYRSGRPGRPGLSRSRGRWSDGRPRGCPGLGRMHLGLGRLPIRPAGRVRLISLPMDDTDENAIMVNAIQSQATVIVQKSLVEGFGLTVAEGMWKAKAVVASAVGGIVDQIGPGTGILVEDPADLDAFGEVLRDLLGRPDQIAQLGRAARRHVHDNFIGDIHLLRYAALIEKLLTP